MISEPRGLEIALENEIINCNGTEETLAGLGLARVSGHHLQTRTTDKLADVPVGDPKLRAEPVGARPQHLPKPDAALTDRRRRAAAPPRASSRRRSTQCRLQSTTPLPETMSWAVHHPGNPGSRHADTVAAW